MMRTGHMVSAAAIGLPILAYNHDIVTRNTMGTGSHLIIGIGMSVISVGCLIFGSLLPDIDEPESTIGQKFTTISETLNRIFGHRGAVHSIYPILLMLLLANIISPVKWIQPVHLILMTVSLGFGLHLLMDYCSYMGIKWFCPIINKDFKFPIYALRYKVGGTKEKIITSIFFLILVGEVGIMFFNFNLFRILL